MATADIIRNLISGSNKENGIYPIDVACEIMGTDSFKSDFDKEVAVFEFLLKFIEDEIKTIVDGQSVNGRTSVHGVMKVYGEQCGIPFDDDETITDWLHRNFFERPRYGDDNTPAKHFDIIDVEGRREVIEDFNYVDPDVCCVRTAENTRIAIRDGKTLTRYKVNDPQGVEIRNGDVVYLNGHKDAYIVDDVLSNHVVNMHRQSDGYPTFSSPSNISHVCPVTISDVIESMEKWYVNPTNAQNAIKSWKEKLEYIESQLDTNGPEESEYGRCVTL